MKKKVFIRKSLNAIKYLLNPAAVVARCVMAFPFRYKFDDETYLKLKYRACFIRKLNLKNPKTYNEKLQWLKLYDRKPEYTIMVDKYAMKDWVASRIGQGYTIANYGVWDTPEEIDFDSLPDKFVLKGTHDSGSFIICKIKAYLIRNPLLPS